MPEVYTVRPQPVAGQQGSTFIRWLDRYAQAHVTCDADDRARFPAGGWTD
jgi:hypothetical protein